MLSNYQLSNQYFKAKRYYAINYQSFDMLPHIHDEFEIMYVTQGKCKIFCWNSNKEKEEYVLKSGEYILIDRLVPHMLFVEKGNPCRILNIEIGFTKQNSMIQIKHLLEHSDILKSFLKNNHDIYIGYDMGGQLHTIITSLHTQLQCETDKKENGLVSDLLLAELILMIARQSLNRKKKSLGNSYIRKAMHYITEHYEQDLSVANIASHVNISQAYLQRLCKEQLGVTLTEKINEIRIEKAKLMLETSNLPILDVGMCVGYNNRQHFTYLFNKYVGCSPMVYRKQKGNKEVWIDTFNS